MILVQYVKSTLWQDRSIYSYVRTGIILFELYVHMMLRIVVYELVSYLPNKTLHLFRFHTDCLIEAVLPHFGKERKRKVEELQREISKVADGSAQR